MQPEAGQVLVTRILTELLAAIWPELSEKREKSDGI